jgi:hypothetical protein
MFGWLKKEKVNRLRRIWAAVAFIAMIVVNGIAGSTTLLGGHDTAAVSDKHANLFAPAGFTFAIWGVIYLLLAGYVAYQLGWFGKLKRAKVSVATVEHITPYFIATSALNILWLFAWQYEVLWLSVVLMVGLLYCLIRIEDTLKDKSYTMAERMLVRNPFSIYFGWISVATIANVCTWLVSMGWNGGGIKPDIWTIGMLIVAAILGIVVMYRNRNYAYGLVFVWAFYGILAKHVTTFDGQHQAVIGALWALIAVLTVVFGWTFYRVYRLQTKRR